MDRHGHVRHGFWMDGQLIGYARCSTDEQDLTAQRQALHALGVSPDRVYIDHGIGDTLAKRGVSLSLGGQIYDPDDPMGKLFFNILATFAEFEVDLIRMRTREGMAVARAQGKLKDPLRSRRCRTQRSHGSRRR